MPVNEEPHQFAEALQIVNPLILCRQAFSSFVRLRELRRSLA